MQCSMNGGVSVVVGAYAARSGPELEEVRPQTNTVGRVAKIRAYGRASFLVLSDGRSELQAYIREDSLSPCDFGVFVRLEPGDLVSVSGRVFRTRTDELTIWAESVARRAGVAA